LTTEKALLFLLAHAGGNAMQYGYMFSSLRDRFELVPLDLPGHGERSGEPLLYTVPDMVNDVTGTMRSLLAQRPGLPYAVFGHSLGSLLGYLATVALAWEDKPPVHLFVSSSCVPGQHYVPEGFAELSEDALWQASARYFGGISQEALESQELQKYFVPLLKADLGAVTQYKPAPLCAIEAPITAFFGEKDIVGRQDVEKWRRLCTERFHCHCLDGGHFYLFRNSKLLEEFILAELDGVTP
jgi:medium-chain acyl-[acyl-carrier-protein] hydrolase